MSLDALRELLGDNLLIKDPDDGTSTAASTSSLEGRHIGLLFSKTYVPTCHRFLPKLKESYESLKRRGRDFEVVYITLEATQEQFDEYYGGEMPWAALPFGSPEISKLVGKFCSSGEPLPVLVMLDPQGHVLSRNARVALTSNPQGGFPWVQQAPPTVVTSFMTKMKPYTLPIALTLLMGYQLYFRDQGHSLYSQLVETPITHVQQFLQPHIDALQQILMPHVQALKQYLHRIYYQR